MTTGERVRLDGEQQRRVGHGDVRRQRHRQRRRGIQRGAESGRRRAPATIGVAGQTFTVKQAAAPAPCTYAIAPANATIGMLGGAGTIAVTAGAGCTWTASSTATGSR